MAPRWSSGHDDFNRRLEVARKIFKENIKRGAQRRMPGDEVAENKNGWENGVEGSQGASTSSLKVCFLVLKHISLEKVQPSS